MLLQQCKFQDAEQVQKIVDRLDGIEREQARKQMVHAYADNVRKLGEKHDGEIDYLETRYKVQQFELTRKRKAERALILYKQKRNDKIGEVAKDKEKIWVERSLLSPRTSGRGGNSRMKSAPQIPIEKTATTIQLPPLELMRPSRKYDSARLTD
jgi:hypothetical protein